MADCEARCLCQQLKISLRLPVKWVAHCHCTLCQQAHGAAFVTWVGVSTDQCRLDAPTLKWFDSSDDGQRGFCANCGTTLLFRSVQWPGELHIARACIQSDELPLPQAHVYCRSAPQWNGANDQLPRFETLPSHAQGNA